MADKLTAVHSVSEKNVFVLSNSAFLMERLDVVSSLQINNIGFISNITREKGIFDYLGLALHFQSIGAPYKFIIAGPVSDDISGQFDEQIRLLRNVEYLGPVYGSEKDAFFSKINILTFPTRYKVEAEPVTILEALRYGIPVIANKRGCIESLIDDQCGLIVEDPELFISSASDFISNYQSGNKKYADISKGALRKYELLRNLNNRNLGYIINSVVNATNLRQ